MSDDVFKHMLLSDGILLLIHSVCHKTWNDHVHELLEMFLEMLVAIYGPQFVVYNVHYLVHLREEAKAHGHLDSFSAFPFENQ